MQASSQPMFRYARSGLRPPLLLAISMALLSTTLSAAPAAADTEPITSAQLPNALANYLSTPPAATPTAPPQSHADTSPQPDATDLPYWSEQSRPNPPRAKPAYKLSSLFPNLIDHHLPLEDTTNPLADLYSPSSDDDPSTGDLTNLKRTSIYDSISSSFTQLDAQNTLHQRASSLFSQAQYPPPPHLKYTTLAPSSGHSNPNNGSGDNGSDTSCCHSEDDVSATVSEISEKLDGYIIGPGEPVEVQWDKLILYHASDKPEALFWAGTQDDRWLFIDALHNAYKSYILLQHPDISRHDHYSELSWHICDTTSIQEIYDAVDKGIDQFVDLDRCGKPIHTVDLVAQLDWHKMPSHIAPVDKTPLQEIGLIGRDDSDYVIEADKAVMEIWRTAKDAELFHLTVPPTVVPGSDKYLFAKLQWHDANGLLPAEGSERLLPTSNWRQLPFMKEKIDWIWCTWLDENSSPGFLKGTDANKTRAALGMYLSARTAELGWDIAYAMKHDRMSLRQAVRSQIPSGDSFVDKARNPNLWKANAISFAVFFASGWLYKWLDCNPKTKASWSGMTADLISILPYILYFMRLGKAGLLVAAFALVAWLGAFQCNRIGDWTSCFMGDLFAALYKTMVLPVALLTSDFAKHELAQHIYEEYTKEANRHVTFGDTTIENTPENESRDTTMQKQLDSFNEELQRVADKEKDQTKKNIRWKWLQSWGKLWSRVAWQVMNPHEKESGTVQLHEEPQVGIPLSISWTDPSWFMRMLYTSELAHGGDSYGVVHCPRKFWCHVVQEVPQQPSNIVWWACPRPDIDLDDCSIVKYVYLGSQVEYEYSGSWKTQQEILELGGSLPESVIDWDTATELDWTTNTKEINAKIEDTADYSLMDFTPGVEHIGYYIFAQTYSQHPKFGYWHADTNLTVEPVGLAAPFVVSAEGVYQNGVASDLGHIELIWEDVPAADGYRYEYMSYSDELSQWIVDEYKYVISGTSSPEAPGAWQGTTSFEFDTSRTVYIRLVAKRDVQGGVLYSEPSKWVRVESRPRGTIEPITGGIRIGTDPRSRGGDNGVDCHQVSVRRPTNDDTGEWGDWLILESETISYDIDDIDHPSSASVHEVRLRELYGRGAGWYQEMISPSVPAEALRVVSGEGVYDLTVEEGVGELIIVDKPGVSLTWLAVEDVDEYEYRYFDHSQPGRGIWSHELDEAWIQIYPFDTLTFRDEYLFDNYETLYSYHTAIVGIDRFDDSKQYSIQMRAVMTDDTIVDRSDNPRGKHNEPSVLIPAKPDEFSLVSDSSSSIILNWEDYSSWSNYQLQHKRSTDDWSRIWSHIPSFPPSKVIADLGAGTSYDVRVRAVSSSLNRRTSGWPAVSTVTTRIAPPALFAEGVTSLSGTGIKLRWPDVDGAVSYKARFFEASTKTQMMEVSDIRSGTTFYPFDKSNTYDVQLWAVDGSGLSSDPSVAVRVEAAPSDMDAYGVYEGISVLWPERDGHYTSYELRYQRDGESYWLERKPVYGGQVLIRDTNPPHGYSLQLRVRHEYPLFLPTAGSGLGWYSEMRAESGLQPPESPTNLVATPYDGYVKLTWDEPIRRTVAEREIFDHSIESYEVQWELVVHRSWRERSLRGSAFDDDDAVKEQTYIWSDAGSAGLGEYRFRIRAHSFSAIGEWSNWAHATYDKDSRDTTQEL